MKQEKLTGELWRKIAVFTQDGERGFYMEYKIKVCFFLEYGYKDLFLL